MRDSVQSSFYNIHPTSSSSIAVTFKCEGCHMGNYIELFLEDPYNFFFKCKKCLMTTRMNISVQCSREFKDISLQEPKPVIDTNTNTNQRNFSFNILPPNNSCNLDTNKSNCINNQNDFSQGENRKSFNPFNQPVNFNINDSNQHKEKGISWPNEINSNQMEISSDGVNEPQAPMIVNPFGQPVNFNINQSNPLKEKENAWPYETNTNQMDISNVGVNESQVPTEFNQNINANFENEGMKRIIKEEEENCERNIFQRKKKLESSSIRKSESEVRLSNLVSNLTDRNKIIFNKENISRYLKK